MEDRTAREIMTEDGVALECGFEDGRCTYMDGFIKGMDISSLPQYWDEGQRFYDSEGRERDALELIKENGVNYIRLRIWNNPELVKEAKGYCNLDQTLRFAKRIKAEGFGLFLDFHYSDWWADPGKQVKPKAWEGLDFEGLCRAVYDYTYEVMAAMKAAGVFPDMVQIGNEIRSGMIFPEGMVQNWPGLSALINSGIQAVRDMDPNRSCQIVLHLDQGGRFSYFKEWFDAALAHGVMDFDMIGLSYYPFWHGLFHEFRDTMNALADRYRKPMIVAEIAHPWRLSTNGFIGEQQEKIVGFRAEENAQHDVLRLMMNITANVKNGLGRGVFYWEPLMVPKDDSNGWAQNMGVLDETGRPLKGMQAFLYQPGDMDNSAVAKIYEAKERHVLIGEPISLPQTVRVLYNDGRCIDQPVEWPEEPAVYRHPGVYFVAGHVLGTRMETMVRIIVTKSHGSAYNHIENGDFEQREAGWNIQCSDRSVKMAFEPEFVKPFPQPPEIALSYDAPMNFTMTLSRETMIREAGLYTLSVDQRGFHTTGVEVELFLRTPQMLHRLQIHPSDEDWTTYEIRNIELKPGRVDLGIDIQSPPISGRVKRFMLKRENV